MLMEMTVPSTSSFDQPGACLADRSPAHEPQEHRAGSESLFTCFWGLRGQTMRVAKKGKLPQGGPEGFRAWEARGRCAFCRANLSSRGRLRGACGAQSSWRPASREDRGAAAGKAPQSPHISYFSFSRQPCPTPDVLSQQKLRSFLELTSSCILSGKSRVVNSVYNPAQWVQGPIRRFRCIYLLAGTNI